jgi:hypothetical protein
VGKQIRNQVATEFSTSPDQWLFLFTRVPRRILGPYMYVMLGGGEEAVPAITGEGVPRAI